MPTIAVDAAGGDLGPEAVVRGVAQASLQTDIQCVLVGDERRTQAILDGITYNPEHISIVHAGETIGMSEDPREAVRVKRNTSLAVAARLVADGRADAVVSAGNTGAFVLTCARSFRLLPGIRRVALASVYPRATHQPGQDPLAILLDVGATIHCEPEELVHFAVMGDAYARLISKATAPKVGLLNMGREETKGGDVLVEAHRRLRQLPGLHFVGNIEGHDLATDAADVIVCEGLVGNAVLKLVEGLGAVFHAMTGAAVQRRLRWRIGLKLLGEPVRRVRQLTDYTRYGGAPVLGVDRVCLKCHGRSDAHAVCNAVKVAAKAVRDDVPREIAAALVGVAA